MFGIDDMAIATVGGSLVSGLLNNSAASSRQDDAQQFSAQQYASRYQTTVRDMEAAGLNPMLAYGGISGSSPTSSAASSAGVPDLGQSINASRMASAQVANVAADTENKKAQAALIEAQTTETLASAQHKGSLVSNTEALTGKIIKETRNLDNENIRLEAVINNLAEHTALMRQQGKTELQRTQEIQQVVRKLKLENAITQADYDAMVNTGFVGRLAREVKPIADMTTDVMDSLKFWKGKTRRETGTTYDRHGRESGGYSRESTER